MSVHGHDPAGERVVLHRGGTAFAALSREWDALAAAHAPSPYATHAWLSAYVEGFGGADRLVCPAVHAADGSLRAAACLLRDRAGSLTTLTNVHSGDWDVVAADDAARERIWQAVVELAPLRLILHDLIAGGPSVAIARRALAAGGFRTMATPGLRSPYLPLPATYDELLKAGSRNMRAQVARRGRQLEKEGELTFRTVTGGPTLDADLDAFLAVEASGWKGSSGTAILRAPGAERVYRSFAYAAAERGWLRLYLLELDGRLIAGDLGCAIGDTGFLVKTAFDEQLSRLSPGLVLRGRVLEASIAEGLTGYDFLGPDDPYKVRWTGAVRPRVTLHAYRPPLHLPARAWHRRLRPALKSARDTVRERRRLDARAVDGQRTPGYGAAVVSDETVHFTSWSSVEEEWDALARTTGASPFVRPGWLKAWSTAFGGGGIGHDQAIALHRGEQLVAIAPLVRSPASLVSPTNWHTPAYDAIALDEDAARVLADAVVAHAGSRLDLSFVDPSTPFGRHVVAAAARDGRRVLTRPVLRSPELPLDAEDFEAFEAGRPAKARREIRRRERRLGDHGEVVVEFTDGQEDLERLLDEGFGVEGSGWKTEQGTAIDQDAAANRFYREVARWAAEQGTLQLGFVRVGGKAAAFSFAIVDGGIVSVLKVGYDPEYARYAVGTLLTREAIKRAYKQRLERYDFLGGEDAYKLEWTDAVRERVRIQAFARTPLGAGHFVLWRAGRPMAQRARELAKRG